MHTFIVLDGTLIPAARVAATSSPIPASTARTDKPTDIANPNGLGLRVSSVLLAAVPA